MFVGLDLREANVAAVAVDSSGAITTRVDRAGNGEAATGEALHALGQAIGGLGNARAFGVAVRNPSDRQAADFAAAAGADGTAPTPRIVTRGLGVALAEQWRGAAAGERFVVALTAADCVQAGVVIDGVPFEGAHGFAGAAGWLALNPVEREDYRKMGCLEAEIGATGIVRRLVWRIKSGDQSRALDLAGGDMNAIAVTHVFDAARAGDGVAISVVRDTARYIGMAIGNLVAVLDPDVIVLGGLIAEAADLLLDPSRAEATRRMPAQVGSAVQIVPGALGADAAAIGAARAAMLAQ